MTENKFLKFVLTESILLLILGILMLILPKVTITSFGFMICLSFIIYGGYKLISAILTRNFSKHYILDIVIGVILFAAGILLFDIRIFDLMLVVGLTGIYFILKSVSSSAYAVQTRKTLNFWWMCMFLSILELFFGIISVVMLSSSALWLIGLLAGIDFIFSGTIYLNMYISTKYMQG